MEGTVFPTHYTYPTIKDSLEDTAVGLLYKASAQATLLNTDLKTALLRLLVPGIQPNLTLYNIQSNSPAVHFLQVRKGAATRVATVLNGTVAENQWLQEKQLPRGRLPVRVNTVYPTWIAAIEVIVSGSLITLTLFLFVYYRNEPEIKATSWSLSLLFFLGCYLIVIFLALLIVRSSMQPMFNICPLLVWLSAVSQTLVLAVLFVKLAHVYRIFYQYTQLGPLCSNKALAIYALALCSPSVVILTIMTSIKTYKWSIRTTRHSDYVEVLYVCQGNIDSYYTALYLYTVLLTVAVVTVALKTRKLRLKIFTKTLKQSMCFHVC